MTGFVRFYTNNGTCKLHVRQRSSIAMRDTYPVSPIGTLVAYDAALSRGVAFPDWLVQHGLLAQRMRSEEAQGRNQSVIESFSQKAP